MTGATLDPLTDELRHRILETAGDRVHHIILFGSRASGEGLVNSDFDVLVVEHDPVEKREESLRLRRALRDFPHPADVHVMGRTEFQETREVIGGIAYPAAHYGIFPK